MLGLGKTIANLLHDRNKLRTLMGAAGTLGLKTSDLGAGIEPPA